MKMPEKGFGRAEQVTVGREELEHCLEQAFQGGGELSLQVTGYSMSPTLRHLRDRVILTAPESRAIRRLDIVLYRRENGQFMLHRVIRCERSGRFIMNGDAQLWTERITRDQVRAIVRVLQRPGRNIDSMSACYRLYSFLWVLLKPFRGSGIALYQQFQRIKINGRFRKEGGK